MTGHIQFPIGSFPPLETRTLLLRELRPEDAEAIYRLYSDDEVTRYYDLDTFSSRRQALDLINRQLLRFRKGEAIRWGIASRENDIVIGTVGYVVEKSNAQAGLGYDLAKPYWRRGIMTEALQIVIHYGFSSLRLNRIQALVIPGNVASIRLLEKLGFHEEGLLREYGFFKGRFHDLHCFSLLKREYQSSNHVPTSGTT